MLSVQLFGTGRRFSPLLHALAVLWKAAAWRAVLRPLLLLLANRTDHRLHPRPWTLPVPLVMHGRYVRIARFETRSIARILALPSVVAR